MFSSLRGGHMRVSWVRSRQLCKEPRNSRDERQYQQERKWRLECLDPRPWFIEHEFFSSASHITEWI